MPMPRFEFKITTTDGLKLCGQNWKPRGKVKAVVCLVHGLGEHCGRYDPVARAFTEKGFAVLAFDLRGHGRSDGPRGHAPSYAALMNDISQLIETGKQRFPSLPVFLYGQSLGGNLVLYYVLRRCPDLTGVIASSPLFRPAFKPPAWKMGILRSMADFRPGLTLSSGLEQMALSRDIKVVQAYQNDPLTHDRISARLAVDILRNGQWNLDHAKEFPLPLLLMHGDADRITSAQASQEFAAQAEDHCTLKIWKGLYHELHNEPEQNEVLTHTLDWMKAVIH